MRIGVLLTIQEMFSSVLSKSGECKSPCEAVGLWGSGYSGYQAYNGDSATGGIPGIPDASDNLNHMDGDTRDTAREG